MDTTSPPLSKKLKKIPSPLKLVKDNPPDPLPQPAETASKISSYDDLAMKLEKCSIQAPLLEGYGCKDVSRSRTLEPFRRRYFVLYKGLLIYYHHKSHFERDKKNGLKLATAVVLDDLYLTKPEAKPEERRSSMDKISFYLHTSHKFNKRDKMLMAVQCRSSRHAWIKKLQDQNPSLLSPLPGQQPLKDSLDRKS